MVGEWMSEMPLSCRHFFEESLTATCHGCSLLIEDFILGGHVSNMTVHTFIVGFIEIRQILLTLSEWVSPIRRLDIL